MDTLPVRTVVTGRLSLHANGADRTPLTVRTGVTGCLSLHVNGADQTLLIARTGVTGRLSLHVNGADWTPVLFTRQSYMRQRGRDCGKGALKERERER